MLHPAELLADQRFLGRAVHLHDPERGAHVTRRGRPRDRQRRERQRGRRAAGAGGVVVVVVVTGMVMRCMVVRARSAVHMPVAMRVVAVVARGCVSVVMVVTAFMRLRTAHCRVAVRMVGMIVRGCVIVVMVVTASTRLRAAHCRVAVRVLGLIAVVVPRTVRGCVIVVMVVTASIRLRAARCRVAVRVLAGRRRRIGDGRRLRVARVGAAGRGAAGMTVSWVVGTLRVGHDNLLYGLTV
nr:hypothetical protein [Burkholderia ambifaria]